MPPGEHVKRPIVIPFSTILPSLEDIYSNITKAYRNDDIRFLGNVKTRLQAAYPLLLPFYLVDFHDVNPGYSHEAVSPYSKTK